MPDFTALYNFLTNNFHKYKLTKDFNAIKLFFNATVNTR